MTAKSPIKIPPICVDNVAKMDDKPPVYTRGAVTGKKPQKISLRRRINLMFKNCIYDQHQVGAWRVQVSACTDTGCPLFDTRPVTKYCNGEQLKRNNQ